MTKNDLSSLARWPLLMGAVILYCVAGVSANAGSAESKLIAVTTAIVGSLMLGSWIWSLAIETERAHHRLHRRQDDCGQASAPPATGETQNGAEGF